MKKRLMILTFVCILICLLIFVYWQNTTFRVSYFIYESETLPKSMDGFRIAQVSDLHNTSYGRDNAELLETLRSCAPDAIFVTGDLIDSSFTDTELALAFLRQAVKIAPVYYCTGNHEHRLSEEALQEFLTNIEATGTIVLDNKAVALGEATLIGLSDPNAADDTLDTLTSTLTPSQFVILLAHKPHYFDSYTAADLIFSGHAHGGQIRLPFLGGLYAPGQGSFPEYTEGMYTKDGATMLVSRGLGNSHRIPRLFNRAELVILELKTK